MYLLDTSICIELTRHRRIVGARFLRHTRERLLINPIIAGEPLVGVPGSHDPARTQWDVDQLFQNTTMLPMGGDVGRWYATTYYILRRKGEVIGANDLWIAAHALALDLTLVTNNEREFERVPDLRIENWTRPE